MKNETESPRKLQWNEFTQWGRQRAHHCGILCKDSTQEVEASGSGIQSQPYQVGGHHKPYEILSP